MVKLLVMIFVALVVAIDAGVYLKIHGYEKRKKRG